MTKGMCVEIWLEKNKSPRETTLLASVTDVLDPVTKLAVVWFRLQRR